MKTVTIELIVVVAICVMQLGCNENSATAWVPTMENPKVEKVVMSGKEMTIDQMEDEDIVVAVNGIPFRKKDAVGALHRILWSLDNQRTVREMDKKNLYDQSRQNLVADFEGTQLLVWESRRLHCATREQIIEYVENGIDNATKMYRMSRERLDKAVPGGLEAMRRILECECWQKAYTISNVPPLCLVTDEMVDQIRRDFAAENAAIATSNAVRKAELDALRKRIVDSGEDFGKLADQYTEDSSQVKDGSGYWGRFTRDSFPDEEIGDEVFGLEVNQISPVLRDEDGFFIVKMLERIPARRDDRGKIIAKEAVGLARIFLLAEEENEMYDSKHLKQDLQRQMKAQAVAKRIEELRGKAEVIYPHGTNFWNKASVEAK